MTVYKKLQEARVAMARRPLKKSGKNKFAGYDYYELGDFLPTAHDVFLSVGLCGNFSIFEGIASLQIFETDTGASVSFQAPLVMAHNPKGQPIQDLGGTLTYYRRYLWMMALELSEGDMVDASEPIVEKPKTNLKPEPKLEPKPEPEVDDQIVKSSVDPKTGEIKPPAKIEGKGGEWNIKITAQSTANIEDWAQIVYDAAITCLDTAKNLDDVISIFRVNRTIFDRLRADSESVYTKLMVQFKIYKESFYAIP